MILENQNNPMNSLTDTLKTFPCVLEKENEDRSPLGIYQIGDTLLNIRLRTEDGWIAISQIIPNSYAPTEDDLKRWVSSGSRWMVERIYQKLRETKENLEKENTLSGWNLEEK